MIRKNSSVQSLSHATFAQELKKRRGKLPSALPPNWPHSSPEDLAQLPQRIIHINRRQEYQFSGNSIKTAKYEWYNFLPKLLLEEFNPRTKIANCYFLLISGLQCVPQISNTRGYPTTLLPLIIVLIIAGALKAMEDRQRHIADRISNSSETEIFNHRSKDFSTKLWSEIQVGDFIRVKSREIVPADVIIINVSEPNPNNPTGVCYVETKSLDGETNLKHRSVLPVLIGKVRISIKQ